MSGSTRAGAVAAGHPETVRAATIVLKEGGNAFDAALAGMTASCVTEPVLSSFGGGGFLLAKPAGGEPILYDFFVQTPKRRPPETDRDFYPIMCDFGTAQQEFHIGRASIATPGTVKGLFRISRDLGRMPVGRVVEPALALARDGFRMNKLQAYIFGVVAGIYLSTPASRAIFGSDNDPSRLKGEGETMTNSAFADTLETLTIEGEDLFYRGEIAAQIEADCAAGGALRRPDLMDYEIELRTPLVLDYGNSRVFTNPPPSTGGILIAFALELLKEAGVTALSHGTTDHLRALVRVMALTNQARIESRLRETAEGGIDESLLDPTLLDDYRTRVSGRPGAPRGTTHISVVDAAGNAAALTLSNGEGAGYIVPGTGIMLNNMLGEEDINPYGFHSWPTDTRMCSMMAPSLVAAGDGVLTALGSGGSNRIRTAILQVLSNIIDFGMPIGDAIEAPRVHFEGDLLNVEEGFEPDQVAALIADYENHKVWDERNMFFGGANAVQYDPNSGAFEAAGDPRRGGSSEVL